MDEEKIYAVYVDLLRLHKAYHGKILCQDVREDFIQAINAINSKHNSCFCYMICESLRQWFWRGISDVETNSISSYYSDLWHFHKGHLKKDKTDEEYAKICAEAHELSSKYNSKESEAMIMAIVADLDANNKQQAGA